MYPRTFINVKYDSDLIQRWEESESVIDIVKKEIVRPMTLKDTRLSFPDISRGKYVVSWSPKRGIGPYLKMLSPSLLQNSNLLPVSKNNETK